MRDHGLKRILPVILLLCASVHALGGSGTDDGRKGTRWGKDYFPNVPLTTHEGKEVLFFDDLLRDKIVVINFIYTSCPDSCPLETARLTTVKRLLGDRVGRDIFMYSISIDPETDTPEVLKKYTEKFRTGPGWTFLTGKESDITLLRKKLGLYLEYIEEDSSDHNLSLIIGNQATGRWMKRSPFENSYFLANQIGSWLSNWKEVDLNDSYANAPELRELATGESLFRTRCEACHTIGAGDVTDPALVRVGPDLLDVTEKREPDWMVRWLTDPEKMLEDKDPIAMGLYYKYNEVPMPNMRLNEQDIPAIIDFMSSESERVQIERRANLKAELVAVASDAPGDSEEAEEPKECCLKHKSDDPSGGEVLQATDVPEKSDETASWIRSPIVSGALGLAVLLLGAFVRRRQ